MEHRCANKSTIYSTPGGHYRITRQCRLPLGHVGACTYGRPPSEGASKDLTQLTGDTIKTDLPESRPGIEMSRTVWLEELKKTARNVVALLEDPYPGLAAWNLMLERNIRELHILTEERTEGTSNDGETRAE
jgi:hypothetical protein